MGIVMVSDKPVEQKKAYPIKMKRSRHIGLILTFHKLCQNVMQTGCMADTADTEVAMQFQEYNMGLETVIYVHYKCSRMNS